MKKVLSQVVCVVLTLTILISSIPIYVFAEESKIDYSNLTANQYLAKIFTNNNYSGSLNNYGAETDYVPYVFIKDFFLDVENRSKARIILNEIKNDDSILGYETTHAIYELLTFNPSTAVNEAMELEDYYTAILLSLVDTQMADDNFIDDINCKTNKTILTLSKNITKLLGSTSGAESIDLGNIKIAELADGDFDDIVKICESNSNTQELCKLLGKNLSSITTVISAATTVNDAIKSISNLAQLANVSAEMQEVLNQIYLHCPDDNLPMKNAARKVYEYVSGQLSYEVMALSEATQSTAQLTISMLTAELWTTCLTAVLGNYAASVLIGQAVGKLIANYAFATDAVDEQLCAISAMVEFEDVLIEAVYSLQNTYISDDNALNSDTYITALHVLMNTYELGCTYVEDFIDTAYTGGAINNILYGNSAELRNWDVIFSNQKAINAQIRSFLFLDKYKAYYKIDAPSAYEEYFGDEEAKELVPITGMEVTQKQTISVGDKGPTYDFFNVSYLPSNHTEVELGQNVASSNESVIKIYQDWAYGTCIEVVGTGNCTLTFTAFSGNVNCNIEVNVDSIDESFVEIGEYPQSQVVDDAIVNQLNSLDAEWKNYNYYTGDDTVASITSTVANNTTDYNQYATMVTGDYAKYTDIVYKGEKYRGIQFSSYRPSNTYKVSSMENSYQDENGYDVNTIYWFKYEPILWRIIDKENNIAISEKILDSQAYNNVLINITSHGTYSRSGVYANSYQSSSLYSWLNNDFYNTAFSTSKSQAMISNVKSSNVSSKVALLGFDMSLPEDKIEFLTGYGSDYAKAQGLKVDSSNNASNWRICDDGSGYYGRTYYYDNSGSLVGNYDQRSSTGGNLTNVSYGVRPIIKINDSFDDSTGEQGDFKYTINSDNSSITITEYSGDSSNVTIPTKIDGYTVSAIGFYAFENCINLTEIKIPNSISSIYGYAFADCTSLRSVKISDKTSIDSNAFKNTTILSLHVLEGSTELPDIGNDEFLTEIHIPGSVNKLFGSDFKDCIALKNIYVDYRNETYCSEDGILYSKDKSELIRFPADKDSSYQIENFVKTIGGYAFYNCSRLNNIVIPDSVSVMNLHAFENCSALKFVKMPCDLRTIYWTDFMDTWFNNCENLEELILTKGSSNSVYALRYAISDTNINKIVFEEGITKIECYAFQNCSNIEDIEFCSTLEDIQYCAFENCTGLTKVILPENLRLLGSWAFENCSNLNDISILSDKMESIGEAAFSGTPFYNSSENWINEVLYIGNCLIKANTVLEGAYSVEDNVRVLADQAFKDCNKITEMYVPVSVKYIGESTFESCRNLEKITLSKEIVNFGNLAFYNCDNLKEVYYNGSIEDWLKYDCFAKEVYVSSPSHFSEYAYNNPCAGADLYINGEKLTKLKIPDRISIINGAAFYNCDSIEEIIIDNSVTHIGESAFKYCSNLNKMQLSQNIENIASSAFYYTGLNGYLTIPQSCTFIGGNAFNYSYLDGICILNSTCEIEADAFHYGSIIYGYENSSAEEFCENNNDNFGPNFEPIDGFNCKNGEHRFIVEASSGNAKAICAICHEEFINNNDILAKFVYSIENGEVIITDYIDKTAKTLNIPEKISKFPVTTIRILAYNNSLENIYIPKTVKEITGIHCYDNVYVDEENEWFCSVDGILYNKTQTELIYYPYNKTKDVSIIEGIETIKNGAFDYGYYTFPIYLLTVPSSIKTIEDQAFSNVYVHHIFYAGTEDEWKRIEIGDGNSNLLDGSLHFNATDSDKILITISPTCNGDGYTVYKCNICNEDHRSNYVDALGHDGILTETIAPTCTQNGYDIYNCSRCGYTYYSNYTDSLRHDGSFDAAVEPTCTARGYDIYVCSRCNIKYYTNYVDSYGHDGVFLETKSPTCSEQGYSIYLCSKCNAEFYSDYVDAIGHAYIIGKCAVCHNYVESNHNYPNNCDKMWIINALDADYITITFSSSTETERNWDYIYIYDADDNEIGKYTGTELASKEITVNGSVVKIRLTSDGSVNKYGFALSNVTAYRKLISNTVEVVAESGSIDFTAQLKVDEADEGNISMTLPDESEPICVYDIYFEKDSQRIQPESSVTVYIPVPIDINSSYCKVYHIDDYGNATDMNAVYENGYMKFTTNHFSYYALVLNEPDYILGDITGDGKVNIKDWNRLYDHINEVNLLSDDELLRADVTGDGKVNIKDWNRIYDHITEVNPLY